MISEIDSAIFDDQPKVNFDPEFWLTTAVNTPVREQTLFGKKYPTHAFCINKKLQNEWYWKSIQLALTTNPWCISILSSDLLLQ